MHVTVAIVGFRNVSDIQRCLAALSLSNYTDFDVVICENGGAEAYSALETCISSHLANGQPVRKILASGNGGYASGVNICLAAAPDADTWWILNPDTEPTPVAMAAMVERLQQGADAVGGPLFLPDQRIQSYGGLWRPWLARAVSIGHGAALTADSASFAVEERQNYLNGASMMVGRRFLETVGFMTEDFFLYCEEIDWSLRAKALGMRLGFASGGNVLHHQGTTTGNSRTIRQRSRLAIYLDERNKMRLTRDHFPGRLPVAAFLAVGLLAVRYARARAWRQLGYALDGWAAGIRGRRGKPPWADAKPAGPMEPSK